MLLSTLRQNFAQVRIKENITNVFFLGKKNMWPQGMLSFTRRKKPKKKRKEERNRAKTGFDLRLQMLPLQQFFLSVGIKGKPTKYRYVTNATPRQKALGVSPDYQFNWFIGGADTCQGDSGGPIWRNMKVIS